MRRCSRLGAAACVLALIWGCAEDAGPSPCGPEPCPEACQALGLGDCDILEAECRERIMDAVICVRGTPGELPEIRTLTKDEYRAELAADLAREPSEADDAGTDEPPPEYPYTRAERLLGMRPAPRPPPSGSASEPPDPVLIAGYYEALYERITLIDFGEPQSSAYEQSRLAHELVHALQDQTVGGSELVDRLSGSWDSRFAAGCLIEGEADLYAELAMQLLHGLPYDRADFDLDRGLKYARRRVASDDAPFDRVWGLRYSVGASYLLDAWLDAGSAGVSAVYWAPPLASVHWLAGYEAGRERREPLLLSLACEVAAVPEGYEYYSKQSLGAANLFAFLAHNLRNDGLYETEKYWREAKGWRQDDFSVFVADPARTAVSWRVRFDTPERAAALARELEALASLELVVHVHGAELEILASDDPETLAGWSGTDPDACPRPE